MLQAKRVSQITLLHSAALDGLAGIVHAFSTRRAEHNQFTVGPSGSENPAVQLNRARFLAAAGMAGWPVLRLRQVHSGIVQDMKDTWAASEPVEGDAAVTGLRGAALAVETADCVPILIADRQSRAVAAVHAGWRGTAEKIVLKTVERLTTTFGVAPAELIAVIGPHNAVCCYEVGDDVIEAIADSDAFVRKAAWKKPHLDQALANRRQLLQAGVPEDQIATSTLCTQCRADLFFSYRRDGKGTGRMLSVIGIAP